MPKQIFGAESVVVTLNRAFNDQSPSNATFKNQVAAAGTTADSQMAFAMQYGAGYAGQTADALSTLILGNLGVLPNAALQTALKDYITAAGVANIGIIALQLGDILSGLENATGDQAGFKAAAVAWNNEVTAAYNYSSNVNSTTPSAPGNEANPVAGTFTLTNGTDFADTNGFSINGGTFSNAGFKFSSGNEAVTASTATLSAADILVDGSTADSDALNLALDGGAGVAATVTNIETFKIASSTNGGAVNFANVTGLKAITVTGAPTAGVSLNNIANSGVTSIDASGITTGAGNLTVDLSASTSTSAVTVKGGAGADAITTGLGNDVVVGGAGIDTISTGAGDDTVTGGAGADVITLGSGKDTVIFEATAGANGTDSITGFSMGAAGGDKLDVSAFLGATAKVITAGVSDGPNVVVDGNVLVITNGAVADAIAVGEGLTLKASTKYVIVAAADNTPAAGENALMYFVTTDGAGAFTVGASNQVATLVGVQTGAGGLSFADANFVGIAA